jgi:hypothetical protein
MPGSAPELRVQQVMTLTATADGTTAASREYGGACGAFLGGHLVEDVASHWGFAPPRWASVGLREFGSG